MWHRSTQPYHCSSCGILGMSAGKQRGKTAAQQLTQFCTSYTSLSCWFPDCNPIRPASYYNFGSRSNPYMRENTPQMDTATIIAQLESERDRLNTAIAALQGGSRRSYHRTAIGKPDGRKRHLSAAARRRIGEAMKKRWAKRKKRAAA
jgi:hypothetical protein